MHKFIAERYPHSYTDLDVDAETFQATINKWRLAFLGESKERWEWYGEG